MNPSDEEVRNALKVLEAAGFEVHYAHRLFEHNQKRQPAIKKAVEDAERGDKEAAMRLISWFAGDLARASVADSTELRSYFAEAFQVIARGYADPATALKLKVHRRSIDPSIKSKRRRAACIVDVLKETVGDGEAVTQAAELLNCDARTVRRYTAIQQNEDVNFKFLQDEAKEAINPPGVIVII